MNLRHCCRSFLKAKEIRTRLIFLPSIFLLAVFSSTGLAISDEPTYNKNKKAHNAITSEPEYHKGGDVSISDEPAYNKKDDKTISGETWRKGNDAIPGSPWNARKGGDDFPGGPWREKGKEAATDSSFPGGEWHGKGETTVTDGIEADPRSISDEPAYRKVKKSKK